MSMAGLYELVKILAALLIGCAGWAQNRVNPDSLVVEDFEKRITAYVNLEKSLAQGLPTPKPTVEQ
jgi:hypothetical protein